MKPRKPCRSILRDGGAAKGVVHAGRDQIDVLADAIDSHGSTGSWLTRNNAQRRKAEVSASHEEMVVFDGDRPAREKAIFKAGADRSAHPCVACGGDNGSRCGEDILVTAGGDREAALHIEERAVPGITDLPGEKRNRVDPRAIGDITGNA